jgi:prefoldin subunit 5
MPTMENIDRKLNQVIKDLKTMKDELRKIKSAVEDIDASDSGMTYLVGGEIKQKLDEILERLPSS